MTVRRLVLAVLVVLGATACGSSSKPAAQKAAPTTTAASTTTTTAAGTPDLATFCSTYKQVAQEFAKRGVDRDAVKAEVGALGAQLEASAPAEIKADVRSYIDALRTAINALPAAGSSAQYSSTMNSVAAMHSTQVRKMIAYGSTQCPST